MTSRRNFIAAATLLASAVPLRAALAQAPKEGAKQADFLFVQTAKGMTFDKATNKLEQLKAMLNEGLITQAQYQKASQQLLNEVVK